MPLIQITTTFVANTRAKSAEVNQNFTDLVNALKGDHHNPSVYSNAQPITTSGIAPNAQIKDTQLFSQITRSGLINNSALAQLNTPGMIGPNALIGVVTAKFGGSGLDGALSITSGTTTLDLGGAQYFEKNYTSISITGTGKLAFSNPHANGTIIVLKSQADVTITSATVPAIDAQGMGAAGGAAATGTGSAGNPGTNGTGILDSLLHYGGGGTNVQVAGVRMTTNAELYLKAAWQIIHKTLYLYAGSGGGSGAVSTNTNLASGAGGRGGAGLYIECRGALNFTGTINVSGANGSAGTNNTAGQGSGGGGGGATGSCVILYNVLTSSSGTITASGGNGGNGGSNTSGGSASGNRGAGGNGGGSFTAAGGTGGDVDVAGNNGAGLGSGAGGGGGAINDTGVQINGGTGGGSEGGMVLYNSFFT